MPQSKKPNLLKLLENHVDETSSLNWSGTLGDYINLVMEDPEIHMSSHTRVLRMIESHGIERGEDNSIKKYNFFDEDLFGIDESLSEIMSYLKAASAGSEVSRRILLLYGPTSSGKSQLAVLLKRGLEEFSKTDEGQTYCLADSPMYEDPLTAVPESLRQRFFDDYGIKIDGKLSPYMDLVLRGEYDGDFLKLPVKRMFFSEQSRIGVGTFVPSDKKSQDVSELVGSMDLSKIGEFGSESDPRAYRFDGELNVANRGIMEFVEMLKVDQKFLYVLLTLAQEKNIKTGRFPFIYADEFLLAHSIVGDEPVPYRKDGLVKFDTIADLARAGDTNIEVIAMNLDTKEFEWTKVKNFYSHPFTGNLIKTIQKNGIVETTYNHSIYSDDLEPFYPEDKLDVCALREAPLIEVAESFTLKLSEDMEVDEDGYARIKDIEGYKGNGQFRKNKVKVRYNLKDTQDVKDLLKTIAWYITEGHVNSAHAIISQQSLNELSLIKSASERISTSTSSLQDRSDKKDRTSRLHLSTKIWKDLLELNCGKYSDGKKVPNFVFNLSNEMLTFFLDELVKGDGSTNFYFDNASEEYEENFFRYKTTSKMLASQVGFISSILGKDYSIYHGYTTTGKDAYGIRFRLKDVNAGVNKTESLYVESLEVFDIACEGNHSFVAGVGQVLCHNTNETEYKRFLAKDEMEALHDRIIVVRVPYNLQVSEEVKIYEKLISQAMFRGVHIAPYTLYCAAMFAILSRLKESKNAGLTYLNKMKLYDGEEVEGFSQADVSSLRKEFEAEGMSGVSPRYIINRLSSALAQDGASCMTPIDAIRVIRDGFSSNPKLDKEEIDRLENILTTVIEEYSKIARNEVQKAFFVNFEAEIQNLLSNYMDHVEAYLDGSKIEDEWGEYAPPNERLMRSIEEKVGITESGKNSFRQEINRKMLKSARVNGGAYNYREHAKLREALEKQLFDERQDVIRLTVSARNPDEEELKRVNVVVQTLCDKHGYNAESANKLLRYVSSLMARN